MGRATLGRAPPHLLFTISMVGETYSLLLLRAWRLLFLYSFKGGGRVTWLDPWLLARSASLCSRCFFHLSCGGSCSNSFIRITITTRCSQKSQSCCRPGSWGSHLLAFEQQDKVVGAVVLLLNHQLCIVHLLLRGHYLPLLAPGEAIVGREAVGLAPLRNHPGSVRPGAPPWLLLPQIPVAVRSRRSYLEALASPYSLLCLVTWSMTLICPRDQLETSSRTSWKETLIWTL